MTDCILLILITLQSMLDNYIRSSKDAEEAHVIVNRLNQVDQEKFKELSKKYGDKVEEIKDENELLTADQLAYYERHCSQVK